MLRLKSLRPSPAMLVACLALFVAMGGAAYAATTLAPNSVGTKQVKKDSLTGKDIKESKLATVPQAASARPIAYARVRGDGTVVASKSSHITNANVSLENTSAFCFHNLPFKVHGAVVGIDYAAPNIDGLTDAAEFSLGDPYDDCAPQTPNAQAEVATSQNGTFAPLGFFIAFY